MTFESIKPPKISDSIVKQIEQLILEGSLRPGEKLPAERDLAQQLNVSRPSLREALLKLEAKGLLQARRGGGTYVTDVVGPILTDPMVHLLKSHPEATYDILELRHALEEVAAYYAALRGTDADRRIIAHRLEALEASHKQEHDPLRDAELDTEFHLAIADASHNVALILVMRGLFNLLRSSICRSLERLHTQEGNYGIVCDHHRQILDGIMQRDPDTARAAAHLHLSFVEKTLQEMDAEGVREERSLRRWQNLQDRAQDGFNPNN
ncbi:MAG: GntR family transcriptional regulator [Gammaproteobacteria bacterium]|nr:GntR family transcriptional regulator [Gammaproteobacteria bacterium]MCP5425062.1 GntR family transcriptional regulator [Gammaproteobacteria bacterium]MCP5459765.1 GntR family transcriptional regulator [Gammaproteobacteria bacterium]